LTCLGQGGTCNTLGTIEDAGATDLALLKFIKRCGFDIENQRAKYLPEQKDLLRFPFDSNRKRMSTVLVYGNDELNEHGYNKVLHCKGAAEIVLAACDYYLDAEGNKCALDDSHKSKIDSQIKDYCSEALRCIAFAYKDLKEGDGGPNHEEKEEGDKIYNIEKEQMVLIGIVGIKDIIREEVPRAVEQC
jgi:magnesium-transporting ATPase (P-type)